MLPEVVKRGRRTDGRTEPGLDFNGRAIFSSHSKTQYQIEAMYFLGRLIDGDLQRFLLMDSSADHIRYNYTAGGVVKYRFAATEMVCGAEAWSVLRLDPYDQLCTFLSPLHSSVCTSLCGGARRFYVFH